MNTSHTAIQKLDRVRIVNENSVFFNRHAIVLEVESFAGGALEGFWLIFDEHKTGFFYAEDLEVCCD